MNNQNLEQSFKKLTLINKLAKVCNRHTFFGLCILNAITDKNIPVDEILKTIKDQAGDNRASVVSIIGEDLYYEIISL